MSVESPGRARVDRRTTIKWLAATMLAANAGCGTHRRFVGEEIPPLPSPKAPPAVAGGYSGDPDLLNPVVPWPRIMTGAELAIAARLGDLVLPADAKSPAASALGVPDFIDEWVSAPYPQQLRDREIIIEGLEWLDGEAHARFGASFVSVGDNEAATLLDAVATAGQPGSRAPGDFFDRFRYLAVGAFYTTAEGMADVGYIGNVAITGKYPGPSDAAMEHLLGVLRQLDLPAP